MEKFKQRTNQVGRDLITQVGDNNTTTIDNSSVPKNSWLNTLLGKIVVGVIVAVIAATIIAWVHIN
jgi:hypothetical protein